MDVATANAVVTAATGLEAPAPVAAPVTPVAPKSRDAVVRALADGTTEAQGASVLPKETAPNADNAADALVVDVEGAEVPTGVAGDGSPVSADARDESEESTPVESAPSQEVLEMGTDIGTGDALFRVRDKSTGQWKASPTDVVEVAIRDHNGDVKTYEKTIPELVRMARDGVKGQQLVPEVKYYRDNVGMWKQNAERLQTELNAQMQLNREMLGSEETYLERREQFAQEMTPDKRAERLQAQINERNAQDAQKRAQDTLAAQVNGFYQTRIQPVVNEALKALPPEMVIGRINADTLGMMVNGVIPPQHWPQYEAYVRGPFAQWAKAEGAKWATAASTREASAKTVSDAQKAAQKAKQEQARTMQPIGRTAQNATATEPAAKLPPPKNKREALDRLVSRPVEG